MAGAPRVDHVRLRVAQAAATGALSGCDVVCAGGARQCMPGARQAAVVPQRGA